MSDDIFDRQGFIHDMDAALQELRAALIRNPQHAHEYVGACVLIESAMGRLYAKRIDH